jgi:hypothetical protein
MTRLEKALSQKQNAGIDFETGTLCFPYPGHEQIFLDALHQAREAAKPAGGLVAFSVTDYEGGGMNLDLSARLYREDVVAELEKIAEAAKEQTRLICVICGKPGKPLSLSEPEGAMVAACDTPDHSLDEQHAVFNAGMY